MSETIRLLILVLDICAGLFIIRAAVICFRIEIGWNPTQASARQISLEHDAGLLSLIIGLATAIYGLATVFMVFSIALLIPGDVPGAMCGTGVMQAINPYGSIALICRLITLCGVYIWGSVHTLQRKSPQLPCMRELARGFLTIVPFAGLGIGYTFSAFRLLGDPEAVSCCAGLPDVYSGWIARSLTDWLESPSRLGLFAGLFGLLVAGLLVQHTRSVGSTRFIIRMALVVSGVTWVLLADKWMIGAIAPYCFKVVHHHCPWCLFLPVHHSPGFGFYSLIFLVLSECGVVLVLSGLNCEDPLFGTHQKMRLRRAALRVVLLILLWMVVCLTYPSIWRFRFGVWITG